MALNLYEACKNNQVKFLVNPISNCACRNQELYEEKYFWKAHRMNQYLNMDYQKNYCCIRKFIFKEYKLSQKYILSNMWTR